MSSDESRVTLFQSDQAKKRGRRSDAPIMPCIYRTSLWGQCHDLGLLELVRSRFSNVMLHICYIPKDCGHLTSWIYRIPSYSNNGSFSTDIFQDDNARIQIAQTVKRGTHTCILRRNNKLHWLRRIYDPRRYEEEECWISRWSQFYEDKDQHRSPSFLS